MGSQPLGSRDFDWKRTQEENDELDLIQLKEFLGILPKNNFKPQPKPNDNILELLNKIYANNPDKKEYDRLKSTFAPDMHSAFSDYTRRKYPGFGSKDMYYLKSQEEQFKYDLAELKEFINIYNQGNYWNRYKNSFNDW